MKCAYISTNPLFGPGVGLRGSNIAVITIQENALSHLFLQLLDQTGLNVVDTDIEEHERLTAITQASLHGLLLSYAKLLKSEDIKRLTSFSTPLFGKIVEMIIRILGNSSHAYWSIQNCNQECQSKRQDLINHLQMIETLHSSQTFNNYIKDIEQHLIDLELSNL